MVSGVTKNCTLSRTVPTLDMSRPCRDMTDKPLHLARLATATYVPDNKEVQWVASEISSCDPNPHARPRRFKVQEHISSSPRGAASLAFEGTLFCRLPNSYVGCLLLKFEIYSSIWPFGWLGNQVGLGPWVWTMPRQIFSIIFCFED